MERRWIRWYILAVFSVANCIQCLGWFAFSAVPETSKKYYNFQSRGEAIILLILNWGPIMAIPAFPVAVYILNWKNGFQRSVQIAITLIWAGSLIRCVPCFVGHRSEHLSTTIWLHLGQIMFALSGPFLMGSVTQLSDLWFPPGERVSATAIASVANGSGTTLGFLLGPLIADRTEHFPHWLYLQAIICCFIFLCVIFTFPNPPDDQPRLLNSGMDESVGVWKNLRLSFTNPSIMLLCFGFGLYQGFAAAWQGILQDMFNDVGWSEKKGGIQGFINSLASLCMGVLIGPIMDRYFPSQLKLVSLCSIIIVFLTQIYFLFAYPNPFEFTPISRTFWGTLAVMVTNGIFNGMCAAPLYELAAEISHPIPPGFSANIIVFLFNLGSLINIAVAPSINLNSMNFIVLIQYAVCFALIFMVKDVYKRNQTMEKRGGSAFPKLPTPEI